MSQARFQSAADMLGDWKESVLHGPPAILYPVGEGALARFEIGPGLVTLVGGAPGQGKTALIMQLVFDALKHTPNLKALICNVEMSPRVLLDRQLARLADVDLTLIRRRKLEAEHSEKIDKGLQALKLLTDRIAFVGPPFNLANVAASADDFGAGLIVLDYIQRIGSPGTHADRRGAVEATMNCLREFALEEMAILVVAALARSKDAKGRSSYDGDGLSLASFRETSELEYGADDAYILAAYGEGAAPGAVALKHLKSRNCETADIVFDFDRRHQRFAPKEPNSLSKRPKPDKLQAKLKAAWESTVPAPEEGEDAR